MNSSGHRENILNSEYKYFGAGASQGWWVQGFK
jgi:uncharacterized protein YkwD